MGGSVGKCALCTRRYEPMICSVISNVEIVSFRIISGHHLTGGAVGVIQADISGRGLQTET